jgi:predicted nucleic acid-binding protein
MNAERGGPRRVFVDTSALFAFTDRRDQNHAAARAIQERLSARRARQLTTNFVIAESHALFLARMGRRAAAEFLARIDSLEVVRVRVADELRARAILSRYDDQDFSYTDATSFAVVERLRVGGVFTFDRDFARYGLAASVLRP